MIGDHDKRRISKNGLMSDKTEIAMDMEVNYFPSFEAGNTESRSVFKIQFTSINSQAPGGTRVVSKQWKCFIEFLVETYATAQDENTLIILQEQLGRLNLSKIKGLYKVKLAIAESKDREIVFFKSVSHMCCELFV